MKGIAMNSSNNIFYIIKIVWAEKKSFLFLELIFSIADRMKHMVYYVLLFGQVFTLLQADAPIQNILFWLFLAVIFTLITQIYKDWYLNIYKPNALLELNFKINEKIYKKAADVDVECYESKEFYNDYTVSINEADTRINQLIFTLAHIVSAIIMIAIYLYLIVIRDIYAVGLTVIPLLSVFLFGKAVNRADYKLYSKNIAPNRMKDYVKRSVFLNDYAKEYRVSNIYNVLHKNFEQSVKTIIYNIKTYGKRIAILKLFSNYFGNSFMLVSTVLYGTYLMMVKQTLQIGDYYILVSSIFNLLRVLLEFSQSIIQLQGMKPYIRHLIAFLEHKNEIINTEDAEKMNESIAEISFDDVCFAYPGTKIDVLKGIKTKILAGQKIAIVGPNGSGKTTFVKLLLRLYDVSSGSIEYNNKNIKQIDIEQYRLLFGVCFQDSKVFAMNVYENVTLDDAKDKEDIVLSAMEASGIKEKVISNGGLKKMLTKEFDNDGMVLSGGEQQKLALARVFAKDCEVVVLDEPTSALDPIAEEDLFQHMLTLCENKTVIFISHRLSSAKIADKILFIKDGQIAEEGSHAELIQKKGLYAEMFISQAQSYQESEIS